MLSEVASRQRRRDAVEASLPSARLT